MEDSKDLKSLTRELEDTGFYGVLLPYHIGLGEQFVRVGNALDPAQKLIYMVAIRPYLLAPQYVAMILKSLDQIDPNRVMLNMVAGGPSVTESQYGGVLGDINDQTDMSIKKDYMIKYLDSLTRIYEERPRLVKPKIAITGNCVKTLSASETYGDFNITYYYEYKENPLSVPKIVVLAPCIREQGEDFEIEYHRGTEIVTENELLNILSQLKQDGIENVMFLYHENQFEKDRIFNFMKKNKDYLFK